MTHQIAETNSDRQSYSVDRRGFLTATAAIAGCSTVLSNRGHGSEVVGPDQWGQWRGPQRDGMIEASWPTSLSETNLTKQWTRPLAESYSGPLADTKHVFTTETRDAKTEHVFALDRETGDTAWEVEWPGAMAVPFYAKRNGDWIRSTPALADGKLVVAGMLEKLVCLDSSTGEQIWEMDVPEKLGTPVPDFGCVCSPLIDAGSVYMQAGNGLLKLSLDSGEVQWHVLRGEESDSAFSSPIIETIQGKRQLLVQTRQRLVGIDLESGQELWAQPIEAFRGMNILTPTVLGDQIFTSTYGGKAWLYNFGTSGDNWDVTQVWENKLQAYMSTPVLIDGHIYLHLKNKRFTCVEATTGEIKWTTTPFGQYWSMISNGKQILALDETGMLRLIEASPEEFKQLDERKVSESEAWAHIGISGNQVFVRHLDGLTTYKWS